MESQAWKEILWKDFTVSQRVTDAVFIIMNKSHWYRARNMQIKNYILIMIIY